MFNYMFRIDSDYDRNKVTIIGTIKIMELICKCIETALKMNIARSEAVLDEKRLIVTVVVDKSDDESSRWRFAQFPVPDATRGNDKRTISVEAHHNLVERGEIEKLSLIQKALIFCLFPFPSTRASILNIHCLKNNNCIEVWFIGNDVGITVLNQGIHRSMTNSLMKVPVECYWSNLEEYTLVLETKPDFDPLT